MCEPCREAVTALDVPDIIVALREVAQCAIVHQHSLGNAALASMLSRLV